MSVFGLPDIEPIYFDHAATTPVAPEVVEAMREAMGDFGNPSSDHYWGGKAAAQVSAAAEALATALGVSADTLVWTSGATESDNLAIIGAARYRAPGGGHIVTSRIEHKAVVDACHALEREGHRVTWLTPTADGRITPEMLAGALTDETVLVSLMWVNNEIGAINDIPALADVVADHPALFHVDAAQAFGKLSIEPGRHAIDLMSLTAHKCYGPKGVGALYVAPNRSAHFEPLLFGGGQQGGRRPGTLPVHQIAGFGAAARLVRERLHADEQHLVELDEALRTGLLSVPGVTLNGDPGAGRLPGLVNVTVSGVVGSALVAAMQPVALATGSACNARNTEPSFVLRALGRSDVEAGASLRFSAGRSTRPQDVVTVVAQFSAAVERLRAMAGDLSVSRP